MTHKPVRIGNILAEISTRDPHLCKYKLECKATSCVTRETSTGLHLFRKSHENMRNRTTFVIFTVMFPEHLKAKKMWYFRTSATFYPATQRHTDKTDIYENT